MILSDECYVRDNCKKHRDGQCPVNAYCQRLFRIDMLYNESELSGKQRKHITLRIDEDSTDREAFKTLSEIEKNIDRFVNDGYNLYIHSTTPGNGKSSWAIRLIQAYINAIWHKADPGCRALYVNIPRFMLALKDNISNNNEYAQHVKNNIFTADLVVWDEIGVKSLTQFEFDNLLQMINTRIDLGKSNIYTSNASPEEIKEKMGERLYSRICNGAYDIEFHGKDKRSIFSLGGNN